MGWIWADPPSDDNNSNSKSVRPPPNHPTTGAPPPSCPMHNSFPKPAKATPPECPYTPETNIDSDQSLNPLNFMFSNLPQTRSPGQKISLPTDRETSSIRKGDGTGARWEYPSPQQMYNAMLRKGYADAPEDAVESMVAVHNWLNEGAWNEIVDWEAKFRGGVLGYLGWRAEAMRKERMEGKDTEPELVRFMGRRKDMTPKAKVYGVLGRLMPGTFGTEAPFDRHDWYVLRKFPGEEKPREVRYVIDYYSGPPEPTGEPVFYLDVRPAIDRPGLMMERIVNWSADVWERASGLDVRRAEQAAEKARKAGQ